MIYMYCKLVTVTASRTKMEGFTFIDESERGRIWKEFIYIYIYIYNLYIFVK